MHNKYRMLRGGGVQVRTRQFAALGRFGVVVLETDHPLALRRFGRAFPDRGLNLDDGSQVAIHFLQMTKPGTCYVRVAIDEAGHYGLTAEVDFPGAAGGQREDLGIRTDGQESAVGDGRCLRGRLRRIQRVDVGVMKNQARFGGGAA